MSGRLAIAVAVIAAVGAAIGLAQPAEGRLERLGAGSQRVSLQARPTVLGWSQSATLFGAVDNGRAGEIVTIEVRDCPLRSFREVASAETSSGGTWQLQYGPGVNTTIRAAWKGATSAPVTLRQSPRLQLDRESRRRFSVGVASKGQMWRKKVLFQRKARGKWITIKTVVLTDTFGQQGQPFVWTEAEFIASVPRRSLVRAVLTPAQAKPCYLAGVSNTLRT